MKRSLLLGCALSAALALAISGSALAQIDNIEARIEGPVVVPDSINGLAGMIPAGATVTLIISNQTSAEVQSITAGFVLYSPDGSVAELNYPVPAMLLPEWPNSGANFLGGVIVVTSGMTGQLPDTLYAGWVIFPGGPYYNSPELTDVLSVTFSTAVDASGVVCIDSSFIPPAATWQMDYAGSGSVVQQWGASVGGYPDGGLCFTVVPGLACCQLAGDANHDGSVNIGDVSFSIARIFSGGPAPACCEEADANGDGAFQIGDVVYLIGRIFSGGPATQCGPAGMSCGGQ